MNKNAIFPRTQNCYFKKHSVKCFLQINLHKLVIQFPGKLTNEKWKSNKFTYTPHAWVNVTTLKLFITYLGENYVDIMKHTQKTSWSSTLKRSEFVLKINENSNYEDMENYLVTVEMLLCQMDQLFFLFNTFSKMMRSQFIWKTSRYFCFIFSQGDGNKIDFCLIQKNILNVVDQMSWFIFMENWICFYKLY